MRTKAQNGMKPRETKRNSKTVEMRMSLNHKTLQNLKQKSRELVSLKPRHFIQMLSNSELLLYNTLFYFIYICLFQALHFNFRLASKQPSKQDCGNTERLPQN
jgi:hypothetical protein